MDSRVRRLFSSSCSRDIQQNLQACLVFLDLFFDTRLYLKKKKKRGLANYEVRLHRKKSFKINNSLKKYIFFNRRTLMDSVFEKNVSLDSSR